jgi:GNAT superfamily N-acetyltransferase
VELTTRMAREDDESLLSFLRTNALAEARTARGGELLAATLGSERAPDRAFLSVLVELDGIPVGYVTAELVSLIDRRLVEVAELYVEPGAREVGAGEALLSAARSWAIEKGACGIDVAVLPGSREAKNFLESAGLTARLIVMHEHLG